jgi:hypothetical protein
VSFRFLDFRREARYAQKTVTFHINFGHEIIENARYKMQTLYSMEHLQLANEAIRRVKK